MKYRLLLAAAVAALSAASLSAQTISFSTGDAGLDVSLSSLDLQARNDDGAFTTELSVSFQVEQPQIQTWITVEKLQPAEVYLVLELAKVSRRPPASVITVYKKNRGKGWGAVARALGIRPGSAEFRALKADADDRDHRARGRKRH